MRVRLMRILVVVGVLLGSWGCAHPVQIDSTPSGGRIYVDDEFVGAGPVEIERGAWIGDSLAVRVEADNHDTAFVTVSASEWFLWPALIALVPLMGVPFVVIPFAGPIITVGWAVLTSPALFSLTFIRRYPEVVTIPLRAKVEGAVVLPSDVFFIPDDNAPNPLPDVTPRP
jgi:PEGA domain